MNGSGISDLRRHPKGVQEAIGDMRHEMAICDTRNKERGARVYYPAVGTFGRLRAKKAICDRQGPI